MLKDPLSSPLKVEKAVKAVKEGMPHRRAAEQFGVAIETINNKIKEMTVLKGSFLMDTRPSKKKYPEEALMKAVEAVRGGMKIRAACKWYRIPWSTLYNRTATIARQRRINDSKKRHLKVVKAVKEGMSIAAVAKQLNVSEKTVRRHINQISNLEIREKPGILSKQEETQLVEWLDVMIKAGLPVTRKQIMDSAQAFLKNIGKSDKIVNLRQWVESFMMRNQQSFVIEEEGRLKLASGDTLLGKDISEWVKEVKECVERAPCHLTDDPVNCTPSLGDSTHIS